MGTPSVDGAGASGPGGGGATAGGGAGCGGAGAGACGAGRAGCPGRGNGCGAGGCCAIAAMSNNVPSAMSGLYDPKPGRRGARLIRMIAMPNAVKTALLLGVLSALFLFLGESLGGAQGLMLGFVFAAVTNFASYWFSDKIVLA